MYLIMGSYCGQPEEEIDRFDSKAEARCMLQEYTMAFGYMWSLWLVKESDHA